LLVQALSHDVLRWLVVDAAQMYAAAGPPHRAWPGGLYNMRMPLISMNAVDYSIGGPLLLERVDLAIEAGERIALIGRNGAGKSTLLRLLDGELKPDDGEVRREGGVRVARLEQEVPAGAGGSVFDVVAEGLGGVGADLAEYHHLAHAAEVEDRKST